LTNQMPGMGHREDELDDVYHESKHNCSRIFMARSPKPWDSFGRICGIFTIWDYEPGEFKSSQL
jgi:hypothetical protein